MALSPALLALADNGTVAMAVASCAMGVAGELLTVLREEQEAAGVAAGAGAVGLAGVGPRADGQGRVGE